MGAFETSEATALTREEMERLRVTGAGSKIQDPSLGLEQVHWD